MKNIAVLVYELTVEYNITVLDGIVSFFKDKKDINLIISPVNVPKANTAEFDYQYWTGVEILKSKQIDAVIVVINSFLSYINIDSFSKYIEDLSPKPIISVSLPLNVPNNHYSFVECDDAYEQIVEHLITKHNRKKIGFITASMTFSKDSEQRFSAYKKAIEKFGLEYNEEWILHGDFTPGVAEQKLLERYEAKGKFEFDALLCANDYTCVGVLNAFHKLGIKCPEDICVFGYDDIDIALACYPTLSTINQSVAQTGYDAARMAYDILNGKSVPVRTVSQAVPVFRQSCGCVSPDVHNAAYFDENGEFHQQDKRTESRLNVYTQSLTNFTSIYKLINQMDTANGIDVYLNNLKDNLFFANIHECCVVFYNNPIDLDKDDLFILPSEAKLLMYSNTDTNIRKSFVEIDGVKFNPQVELVPKEYRNIIFGKYLLIPIFNKSLNYGYLIFFFENNNYPLFSIYAKILSNSIIQSYENTKNKSQQKKLLIEKQNLNLKSKTDELTQVLNRRGFFEYGQRLVSLSASMDKFGSVFFCDLDGLKKINDTYGHEIGDLAIQTEAQVLKAAFRENDLIGRLSGDEFGVVAPGFPSRKIDDLRKKLIVLNEEFSKANNLPFTLSISVGCVDFNNDKSDLQALLTCADEKLYEEKHIKHSQK